MSEISAHANNYSLKSEKKHKINNADFSAVVTFVKLVPQSFFVSHKTDH